jgi:hypothetical protein
MPGRLSRPSAIFGDKNHIVISSLGFVASAESHSHNRDGMPGDMTRSRGQKREGVRPDASNFDLQQ